MKSFCLIIFLVILAHFTSGQTWDETLAPTRTSGYNTSIQLTHIGWGSHHGILFNARRRAILNEGNLLDNGNVEHNFDEGPYGSGAGAIMFLGNGGRMDFLVSGPSNGAGLPVNWDGVKMSIVRNGNVGIGTSNPDYKLTVNGGIRSFTDISGDYVELRNSFISTDKVQGLRIDAGSTNKIVYGLVGIATSSYSVPKLATAIGVYGETPNNPLLNYAGLFNGNLGYTAHFGKTSDRDLKENIKELPSSLDLLMKIKPKQYSYKKIERLHLPSGDQAGFIAQEIEELLPNLVMQGGIPIPNNDSTNNESQHASYLTMDYVGLIPYIVKSLQEQQVIIEKQNALIESILLKDSVSSSTNLSSNKIPHIVNLYPNPAQNQLEIECFTNGQTGTIYLYNKDGKVYRDFTIEGNSSTISLETYENGIYIVALFVNGKVFDIKRFIVSK